MRAPMDVIGQAVFQAAGDRNDITAWHDFETLGKARAFASSAKLRAAMKSAGVKGVPKIWFAAQAK